MNILRNFIPMDRRQALARGESLPDRTAGAALFADLSGFTTLTAAFAEALGAQQGAEEITRALNEVFAALIAEVHRYGGSVIGFSGDGLTCWFDAARSGSAPGRAVTAALAMQAAMAAFAALPTPGGGSVALALKVAVAAGPIRRYLVGDPRIQVLDTLAGATLDRVALGAELACSGEILLDPLTMAALSHDLAVREWRLLPGSLDPIANPQFAVLDTFAAPAPPAPWPPLPLDAIADEEVRPWLLPTVWERLHHGQAGFLAELRPAVALFLHFCGLDPDHPATCTRLDRYVRWVQGVLACYDAALLQLTLGEKGNYLYASFGAPLAHADDTARAVAAALELLSPPPECDGISEVAIALGSGHVWAGAYGGTARQTYSALGDTVNLTAHLMQAAAPGTVLATAEVPGAAGPRFTWEAIPSLWLKGRMAPSAVYRLCGETALRDLPVLEPSRRGPLVGRTDELALLDARMALAGQGQGQVVGITGEAGLGKSRLVAEAAARAEAAGFPIYAGAAQAYGVQTPYLAWQGVWSRFFDLNPAAPPAAQIAGLAEMLRTVNPLLPERLPLLGPVLGLAIPETPLTAALEPELRQASLEALLIDCLRARAAERPMLFVLEDCHWLDPLSHDLLDALARAIRTLPVLLLFAYRPLDLLRLQAPRVTAQPHFTEIHLTHLAPEEAAQLIAARLEALGAGPAAPELVIQLTTRAEGNPFYLEELLAYLVESGVDPQNPAAVAQLEWPASLHSLLLARIDQLTAAQRDVLKIASVVGRRFPVPQLWGVYPDLGDQAQILDDLDELTRQDLTTVEMLEPEPTYLFKHVIIQEVAHGSLPRSLRARLHEQFAAWLESGHGASGPPPVDLLAYHYGQSDNLAKQCEYYRKAGDAAAAAYANAAAVDYYERLLPLLDTADTCADRAGVLLALGEVLDRIGSWDAAAARYQEILDFGMRDADAAASGAGFPWLSIRDPQWARAALGLGVVRRKQALWPEATAWLGAARTGFAALDDYAGESRALIELGEVYELQGAFAKERTVSEEGLRLAELAGEEAGRLRALVQLASVFLSQGDTAEARTLYEEILAGYRALGDRPGIAYVLNTLGIASQRQGDYEGAKALYEESLALCRELGDRAGIARALLNLAQIAYNGGDLATTESLWEESLTLFRELGNRLGVAVTLGNLGVVIQNRGDLATARARFEESLALCRDLGAQAGAANALINLADLEYEQGNWAAARADWEESLRLCREMGEKRSTAYGLMGLASFALAADPTAAGAQRAARLGGAAAGVLATGGTVLEPTEQEHLDSILTGARAVLGEGAFVAAWTAGLALPWEAAVVEALGEAPFAITTSL